MNEVIDRDLGWKKIKKSVAKAAGRGGIDLDVGIQGDGKKHPTAPMTNALLMAIHEFGWGVRERPALRHTFDANKAKYEKELQKIAVMVAKGGNIKSALNVFGERVRADIIQTVKSSPGSGGGPLKGWAPSTMASKAGGKKDKSGDPVLWDDGKLIQAIRSVVT